MNTSSLYYDKLEEGSRYQDWVMERLAIERGWIIQLYSSRENQYRRGESRQGVEIKLDKRCTDTGRLSIEIAEKTKPSNPEWIPSGIHRQDNSIFYIQGNLTMAYVFVKRDLLIWERSRKPEISEYNGTLRKWYLDLADARKLALFTIGVNNENENRTK